jgi:flavin-dependent dehydrogenase
LSVLPERADVAVVGAGPAGATVSALLARAGLDVVCFERERFPRFHVGESLLPAITPLFERVGLGPRLAAAGFLRKYGAAFFDEDESRQVILNFRPGPMWAEYAYNVPRAEFDRLLLEHAVKEGARVVEGAEVRDIRIEADRVRLHVALDGVAEARPVEARFLIDATGRDTLLASRLGRREPMPGLGRAALFAHYAGGNRWEGRMEGHIRIFLFRDGWFWWIPFAGDVTSVGCVLHRRAVRRGPGLEALFEEAVAACPAVARCLTGARRVGGVWSAANFSYRADPVVGDRFVALGDAVTFVDPIFSTGVYLAMQSAELAAPAIAEGFRRGEFRAAGFDGYRRRVAPGARLFFEFIDRYYDPAFLDVFFAAAPPASLRDALTTVLAGGAFLERPLWLRLRLATVRFGVRYARWQRRRAGLPVESRLRW